MYKKRLQQYVDEDEIYQGYKNGEEPSHNDGNTDFEWFCIEHCRDIDCLLKENIELRERLKETNKGLRKVILRSMKWKNRYYKERKRRKEDVTKL